MACPAGTLFDVSFSSIVHFPKFYGPVIQVIIFYILLSYEQVNILGCDYDYRVTCTCTSGTPLAPSPPTAPTPSPMPLPMPPSLPSSTNPWYPDWSFTNTCQNDGNQPSWMAEQYFSSTLSECCMKWYWWDPTCD